jgi:3-phosphoshikimate 1-carboxyvinyltransferase
MAVLVGDASLNKRPMRRVLQPLVQMGAMAFSSPSGTPPVLLLGRKLRAIRYRLPVASAQLKSALLLAALQAEGETMLIDPVPSRDHTERMLRQMGAIVERLGDEVRIWGQQPLRAIDYSVPGDFSSAAAFITAAMLSPGSSVLVQDVGLNSTRTGLLNVFRRMGAQIKVRKHASPDEKGEAWGEIKVTAAWRLSATEVLATEIPRLIDEVPLLVTAACQAKGTTVINGISELRVKESDRVESIVGPLRQLGAQIDVKGDQLVVRGQPGPFRGGLTVDAAHDHRIAMALAVAATVSDQPLQIAGAEWVDISYPNFFVHLERLQEAGKCAF